MMSTIMGPSDEALLERLQANDDSAYRALVLRHVDQLYGLAFGILRARPDAEDVTESVLVDLWTSRHQATPDASPLVVRLGRAVVGRCLAAGPEPGLDEPEPWSASSRCGDMAAGLERALLRLTLMQRAALALDLVTDIAGTSDALCLSIAETELLLQSARRRLRGLLPGA